MTRFPMAVRCYGRRYEARDQDELDLLLDLLVKKDLRNANRYRVGASWPRGARAKPWSPLERRPVLRPPEPDGAVDLSECPNLRRCRCGRCARCGAPKHCSLHAPMWGELSGSSPWGHRFEEIS